MEYTVIIVKEDPERFIAIVNKYIKAGWKLQGGGYQLVSESYTRLW